MSSHRAGEPLAGNLGCGDASVIDSLAGEAGTLIVFLAGLSYIAVGLYLLQTASRENGGPSFFLGLALVLNGFSFGFSGINYVAGTDRFLEPLTFISRICSAACSVSIAVFTWRVFRNHSRWGALAVGLSAAVIALGLSFTAPPFYRRWIGASTAAASKG